VVSSSPPSAGATILSPLHSVKGVSTYTDRYSSVWPFSSLLSVPFRVRFRPSAAGTPDPPSPGTVDRRMLTGSDLGREPRPLLEIESLAKASLVQDAA
jgi:hypothetical protein